MRIVFLSLLAITPVFADQCISSCECDDGPQLARATIRHREAGGIGYSRGYTSLDFFSTTNGENFHPYVDLRAHVFNDGKPAFNTGLGVRWLPDCDDVIYGFNANFDFREANHMSLKQIGLGLEAFTADWDFHLNGYIPLGQTKRGYHSGFDKFQEHTAFVFKKYEIGLFGFDALAGYTFYRDCNFNLQAQAGGYFFHGKFSKNAGGGLIRARASVWDYVMLEGQVSYDSLFRWNGQGELSLSLPLGKVMKRYPRQISCCDDYLALEKRLVERPDRFEIIPATTHKKTSRARDRVTGEVLNFVFVDNTSSSLGTYESPYPTLAQAEANSKAGDVIYVFPGDGTSKGYDAGITLKDRQSLVGSGAPFEVQSQFGSQMIPAQTAAKPILTHPTSTVIMLAKDNTLSGVDARGNPASFDPVVFGDHPGAVYVRFVRVQHEGDGDVVCLQFIRGVDASDSDFLGRTAALASTPHAGTARAFCVEGIDPSLLQKVLMKFARNRIHRPDAKDEAGGSYEGMGFEIDATGYEEIVRVLMESNTAKTDNYAFKYAADFADTELDSYANRWEVSDVAAFDNDAYRLDYFDAGKLVMRSRSEEYSNASGSGAGLNVLLDSGAEGVASVAKCKAAAVSTLNYSFGASNGATLIIDAPSKAAFAQMNAGASASSTNAEGGAVFK